MKIFKMYFYREKKIERIVKQLIKLKGYLLERGVELMHADSTKPKLTSALMREIHLDIGCEGAELVVEAKDLQNLIEKLSKK